MLSVDGDYATRTLQDLVRINSVNPGLDPGAPGECEIAAYVADALERLGLKVTLHEPQPGRVSVVGRLKGSGPGRSLMLNAHVDTVDAAGMEDPFSGAIRDGRLYGRGAFDMKGGLAASMAAVKALADAGCPHNGEVLVAAVADEEYASLGTEDLVTRYHPDAAIVTEPTALDICLAHKGFAWFEVTTSGRAAHGSRFDLGIDANMRMGRVLAGLDALEQDLRARPPHPLVGPPSLHAATLAGGSGAEHLRGLVHAPDRAAYGPRRTRRAGRRRDRSHPAPGGRPRCRRSTRNWRSSSPANRSRSRRMRRSSVRSPMEPRPCWAGGRRLSDRRRGWMLRSLRPPASRRS